MQIDKTIKNAALMVVTFLITASPTYSASTTLPAFYNLGTGTTLGIVYTPTSSAIDLRNIMNATWNLKNGNRYFEKYIFNLPYPGSPQTYRQAKEKAAAHGLMAFFGNAFHKNELIEIEICDPTPAPKKANLINLSGNKLINFFITQPLDTQGSVNRQNHKALVQASSVEKVLDNAINLKGVKQANVVTIEHGKVVLAEKNKPTKHHARHLKRHSKSDR